MSAEKGKLRGWLCYVGFWVTGIIFLVIEKKDKTVRFHAMQSLVVFGILNIIWGVANYVRVGAWVYAGSYTLAVTYLLAATVVFGIFFAIWWTLWGILMYRTYHGRPWKAPAGLGTLSEKLLAKLDAKS